MSVEPTKLDQARPYDVLHPPSNNNNNNNNNDHKQVFSKYLASCSLLSNIIRREMAGLEMTFIGWISCFLI